jgi:hypothetical protein
MEEQNKRSLSGSKMEIAKRLKGIGDIAEPSLLDTMIDGFLPEDQRVDVKRAIGGLSEEDEFALLCRMMKTTTHIVRIDQAPIVVNDTIAPDFLVRFQPGSSLLGLGAEQFCPYRAFVEVKSTTKDTFKIGSSNLAKRRALLEHSIYR